MDVCFIAPRVYLLADGASEGIAGGAQKQVFMIATEMAKRGLSVGAIVADYGQGADTIVDGIQYIRGMDEQRGGRANAIANGYKLTCGMRKAASKTYVLRGYPRILPLVRAVSSCMWSKCVFWLSNNSSVERDYLRKRYGRLSMILYGQALKLCDTVIAQTEVQAEMLEAFGRPPDMIVPNACETPPVEQIRKGRERQYVLWVGSSDKERKQPELVFQIARALPQEHIVMISKPMLGNLEYHEQLVISASRYPNITFVGGVAPEKIGDYFANAIVLLNTSRYEGMPNTMLEALSYATPVIALEYPVEQIVGATNAAISANSLRDMIASVRDLAPDDDTREIMGAKGRRLVEEQFSVHNLVQSLADRGVVPT